MINQIDRTFKIAAWNVNSLRVRLPHVLAWLEKEKPDVLALQETKILDADFPLNEIQNAGYSVIYNGQKTYNGVAVLMRADGASEITTEIPGMVDPQKRILGVTYQNIRIFNLYVPNGESVSSDKYHYKLNWLRHLYQFIQNEFHKYSQWIILGDFNIALQDIDVHDPAMWEGRVLFSQDERQALQEILQLGFFDCFRMHSNEKIFSWWDYRMNAFKRNLGLRIDHIFASEPMRSKCVKCYIDTHPRTLERPSDHAPVVAQFII